MELERFQIQPHALAAIPAKERALFIVLAHAMNELNVLNKLVMFCNNFENEPVWRAQAQVCQTLVLIRTIAGKLLEAWEAVRVGYLKSKVCLTYDARLDAQSSAALLSLKKYFGKKNTAFLIRNNFAFHYSLDLAEKSDLSAASEAELPIYMGSMNANSLYQFAEFAMNKALLDAVDPSDSQRALDIIVAESMAAVRWFNHFSQGLLFEIADTYLDLPSGRETIDIGAVPTSTEVRIPYYLNWVVEPQAI